MEDISLSMLHQKQFVSFFMRNFFVWLMTHRWPYKGWTKFRMYILNQVILHEQWWIWGVDFAFGIEDTFVISRAYAFSSFAFNAHPILMPWYSTSIAMRFHIQCVHFHRRANQIITIHVHAPEENLYSFACFACPLCADTHLINFWTWLDVCVCDNL